MIIERHFAKTSTGKALKSKQALEKMKSKLVADLECSFIATISYIGDGTYTFIACTSETETQIDPQEATK